MQRSTVIAGVGLCVFLGALAGADYWFKERFRPGTDVAVETLTPTAKTQTGYTIDVPKTGSQATIAITSSAGTVEHVVVKKGTSIKKRSGVKVDEVLAKLQLIEKETSEMSLLSLVDGSPNVKTVVLLRNNDRALLLSWMESDEVKTTFAALKKALQEQFSSMVHDLVDEQTVSAAGTPMDTLSFVDPAISKEQILFLRVRNRLYEIHVAKNGEEVLDALVEELGR